MLIRKIGKYEMSHRVIGAYTERCSKSNHGHSYKVEFILEGRKPDDAMMVLDFGLLKRFYAPFWDSFDHACMVWVRDDNQKEVEYFKNTNERYILAPFSSTAEMQAKMFFTYSEAALRELRERKLIHDFVKSGDETINTDSVIVHETDTGYAQYRFIDAHGDQFPAIWLKNITFSQGIKKEWSPEFTEFYNHLITHHDGL